VVNASHELRTPLAIVRGYLDAARGRAAGRDGELSDDLAAMAHEVDRLQQRIDDLFALSQAEVGRLTLRAEPIDTAALVRRVVATTAPLAWRQRQVQVLAEIDPEVPFARADAQRVEQALSNLLANALRHTPPGGLVAAAVHAADGAVVLEVRDTGSGISAADLPHVFERYFRGQTADADADGVEPGAGLGLALVKELTEAMGGSVAVESTTGAGSCFTMRLPCA
jgi:signal transduction histidine kinase